MPEPLQREIGRAIWTELVILGFFALPVWLGGPSLIIAMLGLMLLGIYMEVIPLIGKFPLATKLGIGLVAAVAYFLLYRCYIPQSIQLVAVGTVIGLLILNIFIGFRLSFQKALLVYPLLLIPFMIFLGKPLLFTYIVVESFDSFAYLGGKLWGKTKAFPQLSPKKTIEGLLIGLVCASAIGCWAASQLLILSAAKLAGLLAVILTGTLFGDLCASRIKRTLNVKDYGHILPGQGGVLDIYDSIIFTAPLVFIYLKLTL